MSFCTRPNIGVSYFLSIGQTYAAVTHSQIVPRVHDTKIWKRIVEAFTDIGVKPTPTAIARKLDMAQPSVRQWKLGETTPSRANILSIGTITGWSPGYIEDGSLPKKSSSTADTDLATAELLAVWGNLTTINKGRLLQSANDLFARQFPDEGESRELQRRGG